MKKRLVFWGNDSEESRVLISLELDEDAETIESHIFPSEEVTETFVNQMVNQWRRGEEVPFPDNAKKFNQPLSLTDPMLPEGYAVDKEELLKRAQTEWNFIITSKTIADKHTEELSNIEEKINEADEYSRDLWNELKNYWDEIQKHLKEEILYRDHVRKVKNHTNKLFRDLKKLRARFEDELREKSGELVKEYEDELEEIEKKIDEGLSLKPLFEELKAMQRRLKKARFIREHRDKVWNRIDAAFKKIRRKRYGDDSKSGAMARLERRYSGLINAMKKMERMIKRDEKDLEYQQNRQDSGGQLEIQLRQAKIQMIEQRVKSIRKKMSDMEKTKTMLEERIEKEKLRQERLIKEAEIEKVKSKLEKAVKSKIKEKEKAREEELGPKLKKAVQQIQGEVSVKAEDLFYEVTDTARAVVSVLGDRLNEYLEEE